MPARAAGVAAAAATREARRSATAEAARVDRDAGSPRCVPQLPGWPASSAVDEREPRRVRGAVACRAAVGVADAVAEQSAAGRARVIAVEIASRRAAVAIDAAGLEAAAVGRAGGADARVQADARDTWRRP